MDSKILLNINKIIEFKRDNLTFKINSLISELKLTENSIINLMSILENINRDFKIDISLIWHPEYKKQIENQIHMLIHQYANELNTINSIKFDIKRENQKRDAIKKMIEINKIERNRVKTLKEEEDVEELCIAKQFL